MRKYEISFKVGNANCVTWAYEATPEDARNWVLSWYPNAKIRLIEELYF